MSKRLKTFITVLAAMLALGTGVGIAAARSQSQDVQVSLISTDADGNTVPGGTPNCLGLRIGGLKGQVTLDRIAKALNMTSDELKTQLQSGKTLQQIAQSKSVSDATLTQTILAPINDMIDVAAKYGYVTADRAARQKEQASTRVSNLITKDLSQLFNKVPGTPTPGTRGPGMMQRLKQRFQGGPMMRGGSGQYGCPGVAPGATPTPTPAPETGA